MLENFCKYIIIILLEHNADIHVKFKPNELYGHHQKSHTHTQIKPLIQTRMHSTIQSTLALLLAFASLNKLNHNTINEQVERGRITFKNFPTTPDMNRSDMLCASNITHKRILLMSRCVCVTVCVCRFHIYFLSFDSCNLYPS